MSHLVARKTEKNGDESDGVAEGWEYLHEPRPTYPPKPAEPAAAAFARRAARMDFRAGRSPDGSRAASTFSKFFLVVGMQHGSPVLFDASLYGVTQS